MALGIVCREAVRVGIGRVVRRNDESIRELADVALGIETVVCTCQSLGRGGHWPVHLLHSVRLVRFGESVVHIGIEDVRVRLIQAV
jgi:hypothetical protein